MFMTIDVETRGLHGEAFAVGYVLTSQDGKVLLEGINSCPFSEADADMRDTRDGRITTQEFLEAHVLPALPGPDCFTTRAVRDEFFEIWQSALRAATKHGEQLLMVADVVFPCETGFLTQVYQDNGVLSVYPLLDVSSILMAKGYDPVGTFQRRERELPAHNPLNDARQSSRIFHALLRGEHVE